MRRSLQQRQAVGILDKFAILFEADASKLQKGLKEARAEGGKTAEDVAKVDQQAAKLGETLRGFAGKAAGLLGVGLSLGAIVHEINSIAKETDALGKLAARLNSSTAAVNEFVEASGLLGIKSETATDSLMGLSRVLEDAALGMGRGKKVLEEIGIQATDSAGKTRPVMDVMTQLAGKMKDMDRGRQIRVMEKLGLDPAMIKLFTSDLGALQQKLGQIDKASGYSIERAAKVSGEYMKARKAWDVEMNSLALLMHKMVDAAAVDLIEKFTQGVKWATGVLSQAFEWMTQHSQLVKGALIGVGIAISAFVIPAAINGAIALWAMVAPILPIILGVGLLIAAFALLYEDFQAFQAGEESFIGQFMADFPKTTAVIKGMIDALGFLRDIASAVFGAMLDLISGNGDAWANFVMNIRNAFRAVGKEFDWLKNGIKAFWDFNVKVAHAIAQVWEILIAPLKFIGGAIASFGRWAGEKTAAASNVIVATAKQGVSAASSMPLNSSSSAAIANSHSDNRRNLTVSTGPINVQTQATDPDGVAKAVGGHIGEHVDLAISHYASGVSY